MITESSVPKASHSPTYRTVSPNQLTSRRISSSDGAMPRRSIPKPDDEQDQGAKRERDGDQARGELAVDDVVAVDRL